MTSYELETQLRCILSGKIIIFGVISVFLNKFNPFYFLSRRWIFQYILLYIARKKL